MTIYDIQFTITATLRPEILSRTLDSFSRKITDVSLKDLGCIINIDCAPKDYCDPNDIIELCSKYFKNVHYKISRNPNFCVSVKWLWSQATSPFIFHLEDDWELLNTVKIGDFLEFFNKNPNLYQLRLRKRTKEYGMWKFGLSPCIISSSFYSQFAKLNNDENPEVQLNSSGISPEGRVAVYPEANIDPYTKAHSDYVVVLDIGRDWRAQHGMSKPKKSMERNFLSWTKMANIIR